MTDKTLVAITAGIVLVLLAWVGAVAVVLQAGDTATICALTIGNDLPPPSSSLPPHPAATGWPPVGPWDSTQVGNAAVIVETGVRLGVPAAGWVIAVATAMQESGLHNYGFLGARNDHDSLGLFQQRPSQGWGTPAQVMDPTHAATSFYRHLLAVHGWQRLPLTVAAQAVQRSAYPDAYAKWEHPAQTLVAAVTGDDPATFAGCRPPGVRVGWVPPVTGPITAGFATPTGGHGVQIRVPAGSPVRAASTGRVTAAGCDTPTASPAACDSADVVGLGWYVTIAHPGGITTGYGQLRQAPFVGVGQQVAEGDVIAVSGPPGDPATPHLYFQVDLPSGPTDPVTFMAAHGAPLT